MWDALREWTIDNPFFRLEWKQWLRRAGPWQMLVGGPGNLCLLVLGFHVLYLLASPFGKAFLNQPLSFTIFGALVVIHLFGWMGAGVPDFRLDTEAREQRLPFIRLLPGGARRVLLQIAAARSLLRAVVLFAPLPIYLTLGWYGSPPLADLATLFLLLMLFLFGPPSPSEVLSALQLAEGWAPPSAGSQPEDPPTPEAALTPSRPERAVGQRLLVLLGVAIGLGALLAAGRTYPQEVARFADGFTRILSQFLERNYVLAVVRWVGKPRPFYQVELAPLGVFVMFWIVRGLIRVQEAGELWARGPEFPSTASPETRPSQEQAPNPAESAPTESRAVRLYGRVAVPLGLFLVLGFFWEAWVQRGGLGGWVGIPTPAGSLAALFAGAAALFLCVLFEGLRCGREDEKEPAWKALWGAGRVMGQTLGFALLFALVVGVAGGVFAGRELWGVAPGLLAAAGALLVFGWGWRLFRNRWLLGAAGPITVLLRGLLHALLWIATYVGPFLVLGGWGGTAQAHRWASGSPFYLLLLQFAPLRTGGALPLFEAAVAPVLVGLALGLLGFLRKRPEEDPEMGTRDPLLAALTRSAREWDNPLFSMALRQRAVLREHLTARVLRMPLVILIISGVGVGYFLLQGMRRGRTMADVLELPSSVSVSLTTGALMGLSAGFMVLAFCALFGTGWSSAVSGESVGSRHRQQKQDLRLSPLTDGEIMRGTLWGCLIDPLPGQVAGPSVSLVWILAAVAYGAGAYWLLVWLGAAATMLGIGWLSALDGFKTWSPKPYRSSIRSYLAAVGPGVLLVALLGFPALIAIPDTARHVPYGLPLLALASAGLTLTQIPAAYRQAERCVRESRDADAAG